MLKFAVFLTSGIGNALYLVPLINALSEKGEVDLISVSPFKPEKVFDGFTDLPVSRIHSLQSKIRLIKFASSKTQKYDVSFIDFFGASRKYLIFASFISNEIRTNHIPTRLPKIVHSKIRFSTPAPHIHESTQYLRLWLKNVKDKDLNEEMFRLKSKKQITNSDQPYITIQPGAGNNQTPWKTWPLSQWKSLLKLLTSKYPDYLFKVLGDNTEQWMAKEFEDEENQVVSIIGKTSLAELPALISNAKLHIGGDSGILHIAGCVGTPTVTISGASDPNLFGWHKVNDQKHKIVQHKLECHPCYHWLHPNRSRVTHPSECPDFKCIRSVSPESVFDAVREVLSASQTL